MSLQFVWDDNKATTNVIKHQVTFEEASTVFADPLAIIFDDEAHSIEEVREIILDHSTSNRLILVSFTERDGIVRIISARRATPKERRDYERNT